MSVRHWSSYFAKVGRVRATDSADSPPLVDFGPSLVSSGQHFFEFGLAQGEGAAAAHYSRQIESRDVSERAHIAPEIDSALPASSWFDLASWLSVAGAAALQRDTIPPFPMEAYVGAGSQSGQSHKGNRIRFAL